MADLRGKTICLLGGDRREAELARSLGEAGASVKCFGLPSAGLPDGVGTVGVPCEACLGAHAMVLPLAGIDLEGNVRVTTVPVRVTRELLSHLAKDAVVFSGAVKPVLAEACTELGLTLVNTGENDELAILNSIPSAEGAIAMAMQAVPYTIHGSNCLVTGLGRTGMTLARMLRGIGANVWVAARKPKDRARASEMGCAPLDFPDLSSCLPQIDLVFNTVPALVLDRALIYCMKQTVAIIDLASAPGGTDFASANERSIHAELAPGLPGRVAPVTAGRVLARVMPELIAEQLAGR